MAGLLDFFASEGKPSDFSNRDMGLAMLMAAGEIANANRPTMYGTPRTGDLFARGAAGFGSGIAASTGQRQKAALQNAEMQMKQAQLMQGMQKDQREAQKHALEMRGLGLTGDARNLALMNGRMPTVEDLQKLKQANPDLSLVPMKDAYGNTSYSVFNPKTGRLAPMSSLSADLAQSPDEVSTPTSVSNGQNRNSPIGVRNNNFGNIRANGEKWSGQLGDSGGFKVFETPQAGMQATLSLLDSYANRYGLNTVRGIIGRWAPPNENNTDAYIARIARQMGIDPDTPLDMSDPKTKVDLGFLISRHENGFDPVVYEEWARLGGAAPQAGVASTPSQNTFAPGQTYDPSGQPVSPPDGATWQKPSEGTLPDGKKAQVQWDTTGRFYRVLGEGRDTESANKRYANVVLEDIGKAKRLARDYWLIPNTGVGSFLSGIPGTNARDLAATLETIRSSVGFDRLQEMRKSSPTGGALGAVSDAENKMLQAALGSLEQSQSEEQFIANLDRVENIYLDIVHGTGNWSKDAQGNITLGTVPQQTGGGQTVQRANRRRYNPQTGGFE